MCLKHFYVNTGTVRRHDAAAGRRRLDVHGFRSEGLYHHSCHNVREVVIALARSPSSHQFPLWGWHLRPVLACQPCASRRPPPFPLTRRLVTAPGTRIGSCFTVRHEFGCTLQRRRSTAEQLIRRARRRCWLAWDSRRKGTSGHRSSGREIYFCSLVPTGKERNKQKRYLGSMYM